MLGNVRERLPRPTSPSPPLPPHRPIKGAAKIIVRVPWGPVSEQRAGSKMSNIEKCHARTLHLYDFSRALLSKRLNQTMHFSPSSSSGDLHRDFLVRTRQSLGLKREICLAPTRRMMTIGTLPSSRILRLH